MSFSVSISLMSNQHRENWNRRTTFLKSSSSLNTPHLATTSEGTNGLTMEAMVGKLLDSVSWDTSHLATSRQSWASELWRDIMRTWGHDITTEETTDDISRHSWPPSPSLSPHRPRSSGTDLWFLFFLDFFLDLSDQLSDLQLRLLSASTSNVTGNRRKAAEIWVGMSHYFVGVSNLRKSHSPQYLRGREWWPEAEPGPGPQRRFCQQKRRVLRPPAWPPAHWTAPPAPRTGLHS